MIRLFLLMCLAFCNVAVAKVVVKPVEVHRMASNPGESKHDFIMRLAVYMTHWTKDNNAEMCGQLTHDGNRYGVILMTLNSQVECESDYILAGFKLIGETIHSHPEADRDGYIQPSAETLRQNPNMSKRNRIRLSSGYFSKVDLRNGAGYLVDQGQLQYYNGKNYFKIEKWEISGL